MFRAIYSKIRRLRVPKYVIDTEVSALAVLKRAGYSVSIMKETSHPLSWLTHLHPFQRSSHTSKKKYFLVIPEGKGKTYTLKKSGEEITVSLLGLLELANKQKAKYPVKHRFRIPAPTTNVGAAYALMNPDYLAIPLQEKPITLQVVYDRYFKFLDPKAPKYSIMGSYNIKTDSRFTIPTRLPSLSIGKLISNENTLRDILDKLSNKYNSFMVNFFTNTDIFNKSRFIVSDILFLQGEDLTDLPYSERLEVVKRVCTEFSIEYVKPSSDKFKAISNSPIILFKNKLNTYLKDSKEEFVFYSLKFINFILLNNPIDKSSHYSNFSLGCINYDGSIINVINIQDIPKRLFKGIPLSGSVLRVLMSGHIFYFEKASIYSIEVLDKSDEWKELHTSIKQILDR